MGNVGVEKDEGGVYTVVGSVNALPHESTKDTAGFNVGINVIHHQLLFMMIFMPKKSPKKFIDAINLLRYEKDEVARSSK